MNEPITSPLDGILAQVAGLGASFDADVAAATRSIYAPFVDLSPAAVEHTDVPYGEHARQRADLYLPPGQARAAVVFIHGGGFVAGDKNGDGRFYPNVGRWLARQGLAAVLPNYRLAPQHPWPAGARDVGAVMDWLRGGHASGLASNVPLLVLGQSAGASHVASWLFDAQARGSQARALVNGVALLSGFYRALSPLPAGPKAYFGDDPALYAERSPLTHAADAGLPLMLSVAEFDPPWIASQSYALAEAVTNASPRAARFHWFAGHNHVSTVQSLGSPHLDAGQCLLRFFDAALASGR